jgi:hypothetical protein
MTWLDEIERKGTLLVGGVIAICLAALAVTTQRRFVGLDSYWHLQTGLDWIHRGLSPWVDHFSFTFPGEPISSQPVMFQVALAFLVDNFGLEAGFQAFKLIGFLLAFVLMIVFLRKLRSHALVYVVILPLFTLLLELRSTVRPELLSYSLSILAVMLYHRARGRVTTGNVLPIALLMLFWTNYHSSVLGYIIFFGFFVDAAVLQLKGKAALSDWAKLLAWGLVVLGVGMLNRGFHPPVIGALQFAPEWKDYIQEYVSAGVYNNVVGIYGMALVALLTMGLAAKQRKFGYLIVTLVLTYSSIRMVRLITPSGIIILCFFASLASDLDIKAALQRSSQALRRSTAIAAGLVVLTALYSVVSLARDYMEENKISSSKRPEFVVAYMQDQRMSGRIFNEYGIGGYIIHALGPDSTVYIDGRTNILYPPEHYERFLKARNDPQTLIEEVEKYDIEFALLESDRRAYSVMHEAGVLGLDHADQTYSLFTRDNPSFPVTGRLLGNPACFAEADKQGLATEQVQAMLTLPRTSSLLPNLGFMLSYARQSDHTEFLRQFASLGMGNEMQLRFAAYRALSLGLNQVAADLLERIEVWDHREYLSAAMANVQLENWRKAEEILDWLRSVKWPYVTGNDLVLRYRILETISQNHPLERVPASYLGELREQVTSMGWSADDLDLDYSLLCAN